jgi:hypothetical protein
MEPKTNEDYMREIRNIQPAHPLVYERIEQILTEKDQELQKARDEERERIRLLELAHEELLELRGYLVGSMGRFNPHTEKLEKYWNSGQPEWERKLKALNQSELDQPNK